MSAKTTTRETRQRWLDPATLASMGSLELVARSVVDGYLLGLHRSPRLGFSQEFAEYRAYNEGDDPRFVDWAVYGRSDRMYIRQYKGETNTRINLLVDCSASMEFGSGAVSKLTLARFLAASLGHLALRQNDSVGLMSFADDIIDVVRPSTRSGQLERLLHSLDAMTARTSTGFARSFERLASLSPKPGMVVVISDFYLDADALIKALRPLAWQGHDIALLQVLDPAERNPQFERNVLVEDVESGNTLEVDASYWRDRYPQRLSQHLEDTAQCARRSGATHCVIDTNEPLDRALREYLQVRRGRI